MKALSIFNASIMPIEFWVYYLESGKKDKTTKRVPAFNKGDFKYITLPNGTRDIEIKILVKQGSGSFTEKLSKSFVSISNDRCFEVFGSPEAPGIEDLPCPELGKQGFVSFKNKSNVQIKGRFIFTIEKKGYMVESPPLKNGVSSDFRFPYAAETMQFQLFMYDKKSSRWQAIAAKSIYSIYDKKCYNIEGKFPNISLKDVPCKKTPNTIDGTNSSIAQHQNSCCNCCNCCNCTI